MGVCGLEDSLPQPVGGLLLRFSRMVFRTENTGASTLEVFLEYTHLWNSEQTSLTEGYRSCPELLARAIDRFDKGIGKTFREFVQTEKTVPHTMFFSHFRCSRDHIDRQIPETGRARGSRRSVLEKAILGSRIAKRRLIDRFATPGADLGLPGRASAPHSMVSKGRPTNSPDESQPCFMSPVSGSRNHAGPHTFRRSHSQLRI